MKSGEKFYRHTRAKQKEEQGQVQVSGDRELSLPAGERGEVTGKEETGTALLSHLFLSSGKARNKIHLKEKTSSALIGHLMSKQLFNANILIDLVL